MAEGKLVGTIVEAASGEPIPARLYVTAADGTRYYPAPSLPHPAKRELEGHVITTTKPFEISLPPGNFTVRIERGPEFLPIQETVAITDSPVTKRYELRRWINLADLGWYSGDMHVHRRLADMPALLLGEDVNVAMPLTAWDNRPRDPDLDMFAQHATPDGEVRLDDRHVFTIYNQEYEPARSPTGAVLLLGMSRLIDGHSPPPLEPVFDLAHQRGGFVDMEKHSWAWAPVIAATGKCDAFELANNHHWREKCLYIDFEAPARTLKADYPADIFGWTLFGFDSWYAYLNCGFDLAPIAGTANGVHPNPFGHCRVYVDLRDADRPNRDRALAPLTVKNWQRHMLAGRSFVTTGPVLFFRAAGRAPGVTVPLDRAQNVHVEVQLMSLTKPEQIEVVRGGDVVHSFRTDVQPGADGVYRFEGAADVLVDSTTYLAARSFVEPPARDTVRFAHSGVVRFTIPDKPLLPRKFELDHFVRRVESMIGEINDGKLKSGDRAAALAEYERALAVYRRLGVR